LVDFSLFDARKYPTLSVREGYDEWAETYEDTVLDLMDLRLLARLERVDWINARRAVDLACGTGRAGAWLRAAGVASLDGVDFAAEMMVKAEAKHVYDRLLLGDILSTGLDAGAYDLVTLVLADEHVADLMPLYREAARLAAAKRHFVLVGYHPHFLMAGIPAHFSRESGETVAIESYVHLISDHVTAAHSAGFQLAEMVEGTIDDAWLAAKPQWAAYRNQPVSFAIVWT
jgi:SAM-dependent methyltransferase